MRLGGQLPGEEIPTGRGTCSLLERGEWVKAGRTNCSRDLLSCLKADLVPGSNSKASEVAGGTGAFFHLTNRAVDICVSLSN